MAFKASKPQLITITAEQVNCRSTLFLTLCACKLFSLVVYSFSHDLDPDNLIGSKPLLNNLQQKNVILLHFVISTFEGYVSSVIFVPILYIINVICIQILFIKRKLNIIKRRVNVLFISK